MATCASSPKRRTSTSTMSTGEFAADRRARISSAQAASASRVHGGASIAQAGAQGAFTVSRGSSR